MNLPVFERIDISGYGLFPGTAERPGLHVAFEPGLTLVLGTNGLGKSTFVNLLYRLLTGPYDISGIVGRVDLGNTRLEPSLLSPSSRFTFGHRVADGASSATARLTVNIGDASVVIERRLKDLALTHFSIDGTPKGSDELTDFQAEIIRLVGVWSFGDWILLLRHLVFFLEDRRALVWDPSAQRQLFRLLFLAPTTARKWTEDERSILELDSRIRNLSAALTREERAMASNEIKTEVVANVRDELKTLAALQEIDGRQLQNLEDGLVDVGATREAARLQFLTTEQERERRFRELERARLIAIGARFPSRSETARYILSQLMTSSECLVCGNNAPHAVEELSRRLQNEHCVVCDTDLASGERSFPAREMADARVSSVAEALDQIERQLASAQHDADDTARQYDSWCSEIGQLNAKIQQRSSRIDSLIKQLPPSEVEMHEQRKELSSLRARVALMKSDVTSQRQLFADFVQDMSRDLLRVVDAIKTRFHTFAEGFLLEQCQLLWAPRRDRVGETGQTVEFPAFQLEMTGTDFATAVRRQGPDQVSESQREFIDLAFRMSLMAVASSDGSGSLVIDAPEASLDTVFAGRAATVLARFANQTPRNRLVIASNLIEGSLIPALLSNAIPAGVPRQSRIVDLFDIATPTAAVRELRMEYQALRDRLLSSPDR